MLITPELLSFLGEEYVSPDERVELKQRKNFEKFYAFKDSLSGIERFKYTKSCLELISKDIQIPLANIKISGGFIGRLYHFLKSGEEPGSFDIDLYVEGRLEHETAIRYLGKKFGKHVLTDSKGKLAKKVYGVEYDVNESPWAYSFDVPESIKNLVQEHDFPIPEEYKLSRFLRGLRKIQLIKGHYPLWTQWKLYDFKHLCLGYNIKTNTFEVDNSICSNPFKLIDQKILIKNNKTINEKRLTKYKELGYKQYE